MKISLLDPGLQGRFGHHYDLDLRLASALALRGHAVEVHGHRELATGLAEQFEIAGATLHPTFRIYAYRQPRRYQLPVCAHASWIAKTRRDLQQVDTADLWFWPTLTSFQLAAAARDERTVAQLGGAWWLPGIWVPAAEKAWSRTITELARADKPIRLGAYDEALCQAYEHQFPGMPMDMLPCPHDGAVNERTSPALACIGFFGHQRDRRGLALLPELISALLGEGYEVVFQDSGAGDLHLAEHPRLLRLPYIEDFAEAIARCDLIVWPSRPTAYRQSWSGVVSEAVASGVPVVAPEGCLPSELLTRMGCGVLFSAYNAEAVLAAVRRAAAAFPELRAQARQAAVAWRAQHGVDRLVQRLEQYAQEVA